MICLDANYLIGGVSEGRPESVHLRAWYRAGERFCTAAPAWYKFLCGPVSKAQISTMRSLLTEGILSFGESQAIASAHLFNAVERPRNRRVDAMIAATAVIAGSPLATLNESHFKAFKPLGLEFARVAEA